MHKAMHKLSQIMLNWMQVKVQNKAGSRFTVILGGPVLEQLQKQAARSEKSTEKWIADLIVNELSGNLVKLPAVNQADKNQ